MRTSNANHSPKFSVSYNEKEYKSLLIIGEKKNSIEIGIQFYYKIENMRVSLKNNNLQIKWKRSHEDKIMHTRSFEFEDLDKENSQLFWELKGGLLSILINKNNSITNQETKSSIKSMA